MLGFIEFDLSDDLRALINRPGKIVVMNNASGTSVFSRRSFLAVICLLGAVNIFLGLNVAFGGIQTMGWTGLANFLQISNEAVYLVQDSHVRFFGGLYAGLGLFLIIASRDVRKYQSALSLIFFIIFAGGLGRLAMMRFDVLFGGPRRIDCGRTYRDAASVPVVVTHSEK